MAGVNAELSPFVRMTVPAHFNGLTLEDAPRGAPAFDSWLLAFGVIPFDRHRLTLVEVEPGRRFLERSATLLQREWRHERVVEAHADGCRITDRVTPVPRIPGAGWLVRALVQRLFRHRHRVLRARFAPPSTNQ